MILLKPRRRFQCLTPGLNQSINVLPKSGIGQLTFNLIARGRLQDNPGILCDLPKLGIELPPHIVSGVIPRPAQIQGKLRQGIEPVDFSG